VIEVEPTAEEIERVIRALRNNLYHRTATSVGAGARVPGRRAAAILDKLIAEGKVGVVGTVFRLVGEPRKPPKPRREVSLERVKRQAERSAARAARAKFDRDLEALCEALARAVEHRANVRRVQLKPHVDRVGQHASVRFLYAVASQLGMPLSELIAAAEVRAGLREQTDVFQVFWNGHGQEQGRAACREEK
jgi:hypothetical protein